MIISLAEAKTPLRIEHDEEDEYLTGLILQAQAAAEDYCRVSFEPYLNEDGEETDAPEPVRLALLLFVCVCTHVDSSFGTYQIRAAAS